MFKGFIVMALQAMKPLIKKSFKKSEFVPYALQLVDRVTDILSIMTDDNKDNSAQLNLYIQTNLPEIGKHTGELVKDALDKDDKSSFTKKK